MSTFVLLTVTGLGLAAMYFLIGSGLSLIYGLMGVLNLAHGLFLGLGSYASWWLGNQLVGYGGSNLQFFVALAFGLVVVGLFAPLVELLLIRPLYRQPDPVKRHIDQVMVTIGLLLVGTALLRAVWGNDPRPVQIPDWMQDTTTVLGASIPNDRWLEMGAAITVLALFELFLRKTRYGLIIRAGVENRGMVTALGIDVRNAFMLVFAIGGVAAALAGALSNVYFGATSPERGFELLLFAFIVVVIGGLGSIIGSAVASVVVGLAQQYGNYYAGAGLGEIFVVLLLFVVLVVRPRGLAGAAT